MPLFQELLRWASSLPPFAKGLATLVVVTVCALIVVVLWTKPTGSDPANLWPTNQSMDGLKARLDVISRENAKFLVEVASADQFGLYMDQIADRLKISRAEADARSKDLQAQGLVECLHLTDVNIRLNKNLEKLLSPNPLNFLEAYLHQTPIGVDAPRP
jgi:hypothetical protein